MNWYEQIRLKYVKTYANCHLNLSENLKRQGLEGWKLGLEMTYETMLARLESLEHN